MMMALGGCVLALLMLALGGDSVLKGASGLSRRFGWSPFVTGLLLVAFGTSIPELAVNARAFFTGSQSLALGNAIGSNIVNFGLTLGLAAIVAPLLVRWRALAPLLICLIVATIALIALGYDGVLSRIEGLIFVIVFFVIVMIAIARSRAESEDLRNELAAFIRPGQKGFLTTVQNFLLVLLVLVGAYGPNLAPVVVGVLEFLLLFGISGVGVMLHRRSKLLQTDADFEGPGTSLLRFAIGALLLYFGAGWLVQYAPIVGAAWGMTPLLTGLIVVAIATALPEAVAAMSAARRGQGDMVVGHVIGSSLFNLLIVVGGMAALRDLPIPASFVGFELPAALAVSLLLYPMLRRDLQISRAEGWVLFVSFIAWVIFELLLSR